MAKLSAEKRKELQKLAARPDREIDLSDIPEIREIPPDAVIGRFYRPEVTSRLSPGLEVTSRLSPGFCSHLVFVQDRVQGEHPGVIQRKGCYPKLAVEN
jgi:hypothetical protein